MQVPYQFSSVAQSCPTLRPHGLQHTRLPCASPTPEAYSNSCPSRQWCHPTISSSVVPFSSLQSSPASGSVLLIKWPKYWSFSFSINPYNEYSGLISFRTDWLDLLAVQGTLQIFSNTIVQKHQFFGTDSKFIVQLSHPYMTTGKMMPLTRRAFVDKICCLGWS